MITQGFKSRPENHKTDASSTTSDPEEVAQKIGSYFQDNFSDKIYKQQFINEIKTKSENIPITFDINPLYPDQINLNDPFSIKEMEVALVKCRSKSPGPDRIPYFFIHNLGKIARNHLLHLYNTIRKLETLPNNWKRGIIIPIIKYGKNKHSVDGHRPITNTMIKIKGKIKNKVVFADRNPQLTTYT